MHHAVRRHGVFPSVCLVDARGCAIVFQRQIVGAVGKAEVRAVQGRAGCDADVRLGVRGGGFRVGRLETEATGHFDSAEDNLQGVQRATGLETVGVGRNPAHGVEGNRATRHRFMRLAAEVGPFVIQLERFFKRDARQFGGNRANAFCWDAAAVGDSLWRVFLAQIHLGHFVEDRCVRHALGAVGSGKVRFDTWLIEGRKFAGGAVHNKLFAVLIAQIKAVFR